MLLKFSKLIILIKCFSSIVYTNDYFLESIQIESKTNGIILILKMDKVPNPENITAWQAKSGWFYITLYKVGGDSASLNQKNLPLDIINFQIIKENESLQIGLRLKEPIENYEFEFLKNLNTIAASLHYSTQYFAKFKSVKRKSNIEAQKGIPKGIKTWLNLIGAGITISGLLKDKNSHMNHMTTVGILILLSNYLIDKIWGNI